MLQTLTDFFLIISKDGEKITNKDIVIFYNFIVKKMPQIEQLYPSLIIKSLNIDSQIENKNCFDLNKLYNNKDSKKIFNHFQKQIINLFNDLIDYCYQERIIKLDETFKKIIKSEIIDINKKQKDIKITKRNYKYTYNNYYQKELMIKRAKKEELRNFLILLIVDGDINFEISPNQYINFFNSENKVKNRLNAEQFMKFIKNIIKIYKDNKKNSNKRIINKSNNNTGKKFNNIMRETISKNKIKTDDEKKNIKNEKNNKTKETKYRANENSSSGLKNSNEEIISNSLSSKNNQNVFVKQINIYRDNILENKNTSIQTKNEMAIGSNNKYHEKNIKELNMLTRKLTPLSDKSIIIYNDNSEEEDDEINDTIKCETPKNINLETKIERSERVNLSRLFLENVQNQRRYSADKNPNKTNKRLTICAIPSNDDKILDLHINQKICNKYSSEKFYYQKDKNLINRNNINNEEQNLKYHQSLVNDIYINSIIKNNILKENNKPINKSQSIIGKDIFEKEIMNIEKIYKKNKNIYENNQNSYFKDKYNLVSCIKKDKNNNQYKELYLYKNSEIHQHLVIFNVEEEKKADDEEIKCIII